MGYCMTLRAIDCVIRHDKVAAALEAMKDMDPNKGGTGGSWCRGVETKHFAWVRQEVVVEATTLIEALDEWRWTAQAADERDAAVPGENYQVGDIAIVAFSGEKSGDDKLLWDVLAPFIDDLSHIDMEGEDGHLWRWSFEGGRVSELSGRVVFDGCSSD